MPVLAGQTLLHYQLVDKIGAGGMGEVWRAVDSRLGREVAVKVLPDRFASDRAALLRFEREARAVAALSHPNILALHDVGQADGVPFVVTELLRGTTLRAKLAAGPMTPEIAVDHAIQITQGLTAAHARGLIHRDLKPENVFATDDGPVKILDFGLARFESDPPATDGHALDEAATTLASPTVIGMVLGTPSYMSPEQARGRSADQRSDFFALGAVLYEMLSGRRAFAGPTIADTLSAVLHQEPPTLQTGSKTDAALDRVIRKCLSKDPEQRFQSGRELIQALQTVFSQSPADEGSSIAILPFVDMSQGKDQDYFCEGMAEEILSALSEIPGLRVAARTSAFQFRGTNQDIRRIGQALGVANVLEGSVRTAGKRLRVTAQLIKAADGYRVWSERYDREMEDVFAIQDEIARSVSQALAMRLGTPEPGAIARKHTEDLEAYHLYLKGRHERYTTRNFPTALRYFEQASERDPRYALARVGIAEACILLGNTGIVRPRVTLARAETELGYAKALAGESAEALAVECCVLAYGSWDWKSAEEAGRRGMELDPGFIFARTWLSLILSAQGRCDEAVAMARSAMPIDPLSPLARIMGGWALSAGRRFEEAVPQFNQALELNPRNTLAMWLLGVALVGAGKVAEASSWFERGLQLEPDSSLMLGLLAWTRALMGKTDEARKHLDQLEDWAKQRHVPRYTVAWTLAALGDVPAALDHYERSVSERDSFLSFPLFPGNDPYRDQPRFHAALRRMGLDWAIGR